MTLLKNYAYGSHNWQNYSKVLGMVAFIVSLSLIVNVFFSTPLVPLLLKLSAVVLILSAYKYGMFPSLLGIALTSLSFYTVIHYGGAITENITQLWLWFAFIAMGAIMVAQRHLNLFVMRNQLNYNHLLQKVNDQVMAHSDPAMIAKDVASTISILLETPVVIILHQESNNENNAMNEHYLPISYCIRERSAIGNGTSILCSLELHYVPLMVDNEYVGTLCIKLPCKSDPELLPFIQMVAQNTALIIHRKQYAQRLEDIRIQVAVATERFSQFEKIEAVRTSQEMERMRSTLLSSIAHDLKTPLAAIIGSLSAIRHLGSNLTITTQHELIETAQTEAERLNHFITNILELTRLESDNLALNMHWNDPQHTIQSLLSHLTFKQISRRIDYIPSLVPCFFYMDSLLIEQVLYNILDNSIKYSPEHSMVTIRYQLLAKGGVITIADHGKGIAEDKRSVVFDKFTRQHSGKNGTGLGLAICKAIVEAHGGKITISANEMSKDDNFPGCVFSIFLPDACIKPAAEESLDEMMPVKTGS
jgi:K+-sensing histidine kinase KdpD